MPPELESVCDFLRSLRLSILVVQNGELKGQSFDLEGSVVIGRLPECDIELLDSQISRRHAEVRLENDRFFIIDLGSSNGTYVNGRSIDRRELKLGDIVQVGSTRLCFMKNPEPSLIGQIVGGCEVLDLIGTGGMGRVYKARQQSMDRVVALKVLNHSLTSNPAQVERFIKEARSAGMLDHKNVVHVYDVGNEGDTHFFLMEFVDGDTVLKLLEKGRMSPLEVVDIGIAIADALDYAHERKIVHGDVKPQNIMIDKNGVKLADLGLARSIKKETKLEKISSRRAWGTPKYMAPELATGGACDAQTDIYALGATLYHMLVGHPPFVGSTAKEIMQKHVRERLIPIRDLSPLVPPSVARVVEKMLAKMQSVRYQNMKQVIRALSRAKAIASEEMISDDYANEEMEIDSTQKTRGKAHWLRALIISIVSLLIIALCLAALFCL